MSATGLISTRSKQQPSTKSAPHPKPAHPRRYGNTLALILDNSVLPRSTMIQSGTVSAANTAANLARQAADKQKFTQVTDVTALLEQNDYAHNNRAICQPAHRALTRYKGYKKLFGERMHASKYPSMTTTSKFMDLPGEVRNQIYRLFLIMDPPIEFCPRSNGATRNAMSRACKYADERHKKLSPILRLLRLNREINAEASDIYYGENEFRFSYEESWAHIWAFLNTIGNANVARLRRINVNFQILSDSPSSLEYHLKSFKAMGLRVDGVKVLTQAKCQSAVLSRLETAGNLTRLGVVLSDLFAINNRCMPRFPLNKAKFGSGFEIVLEHLQQTAETNQHHLNFVGKVKRNDAEIICCAFANPGQYARYHGWKYEKLLYDWKGRYNSSSKWAGGHRLYDSDEGLVEDVDEDNVNSYW